MQTPAQKPHYCNVPVNLERELELARLAKILPSARIFSILMNSKRWVAGSVLTYYFFNDTHDGSRNENNQWVSWVGTEAEKDQVRKAFQMWRQIGINLDFREVDRRDSAIIRIGFMIGDGSWSYLGTDCKKEVNSKNERTMNFGWDITNDLDTALHEVGHSLGLTHEHQNPKAGIEWNEEAVYAALAEPPNSWDRETTYQNIIKKLPVDEIQNSTWDANSCMHYPFESGLINSPEHYKNFGIQPQGGLSARDREWIKHYYPADAINLIIEPLAPLMLQLKNGEQISYTIMIEESREYDFQTAGEADVVLVLFELDPHLGWVQIAASDDSGHDTNAHISHYLDVNKKYSLRLRLYWSARPGRSLLTMW